MRDLVWSRDAEGTLGLAGDYCCRLHLIRTRQSFESSRPRAISRLSEHGPFVGHLRAVRRHRQAGKDVALVVEEVAVLVHHLP